MSTGGLCKRGIPGGKQSCPPVRFGVARCGSALCKLYKDCISHHVTALPRGASLVKLSVNVQIPSLVFHFQGVLSGSSYRATCSRTRCGSLHRCTDSDHTPRADTSALHYTLPHMNKRHLCVRACSTRANTDTRTHQYAQTQTPHTCTHMRTRTPTACRSTHRPCLRTTSQTSPLTGCR
jgi:hypothetical protein